MPNLGVDPLNAAAHILIALQEIHSRELAMGNRTVLTVGTMHAGTAANAIPDIAVMGGRIRGFRICQPGIQKQSMILILKGLPH